MMTKAQEERLFYQSGENEFSDERETDEEELKFTEDNTEKHNYYAPIPGLHIPFTLIQVRKRLEHINASWNDEAHSIQENKSRTTKVAFRPDHELVHVINFSVGNSEVESDGDMPVRNKMTKNSVQMEDSLSTKCGSDIQASDSSEIESTNHIPSVNSRRVKSAENISVFSPSEPEGPSDIPNLEGDALAMTTDKRFPTPDDNECPNNNPEQKIMRRRQSTGNIRHSPRYPSESNPLQKIQETPKRKQGKNRKNEQGSGMRIETEATGKVSRLPIEHSAIWYNMTSIRPGTPNSARSTERISQKSDNIDHSNSQLPNSGSKMAIRSPRKSIQPNFDNPILSIFKRESLEILSTIETSSLLPEIQAMISRQSISSEIMKRIFNKKFLDILYGNSSVSSNSALEEEKSKWATKPDSPKRKLKSSKKSQNREILAKNKTTVKYKDRQFETGEEATRRERMRSNKSCGTDKSKSPVSRKGKLKRPMTR